MKSSAYEKRGRYIVFEGDEGAGKTTQIERFRQRLEERGTQTSFVREPGGDKLAEQLREIVKHAEYTITGPAEVGLFSAARANLLANVIRPLLQRGVWVVSDRSYLSTLVYQGHARGLDSDSFRDVVRYFASVQLPDLTLVLDIPADVSRQRILTRQERTDRFERADNTFRLAVNEGYRQIARSEGLPLINGQGSKSVVEHRVWNAFKAWAATQNILVYDKETP